MQKKRRIWDGWKRAGFGYRYIGRRVLSTTQVQSAAFHSQAGNNPAGKQGRISTIYPKHFVPTTDAIVHIRSKRRVLYHKSSKIAPVERFLPVNLDPLKQIQM